MTNVDKPEEGMPVIVTGEERAHPSVRLLARACIEMARQQIARSKADDLPEDDAHLASRTGEDDDRKEDGRRG